MYVRKHTSVFYIVKAYEGSFMRIISGEFKNRKIKMPYNQVTRPTSQKVRKAIFDVLADLTLGKNVLDLYSGSGAIGLEALSKGADHVTFVEKNKKVLRIIKENVSALQIKNKTAIIGCEALSYLEKMSAQKQKFDLIFADPPYSRETAKKCLLKISNCDILTPSAIVVLEHYKKDELPKDCGALTLWQLKNYGDTFVSFYTHT
jgi:16S rRNA (guanine(966)-N(2))-methyltransferase RsmD